MYNSIFSFVWNDLTKVQIWGPILRYNDTLSNSDIVKNIFLYHTHRVGTLSVEAAVVHAHRYLASAQKQSSSRWFSTRCVICKWNVILYEIWGDACQYWASNIHLLINIRTAVHHDVVLKATMAYALKTAYCVYTILEKKKLCFIITRLHCS